MAKFYAVLLSLLIFSTSVFGQWPTTKTIKIVVPFPTGGAPDILGRVLSQKLSTELNQYIIVENKPGNSGSVGSEFVSKSAPDGYTLLLTIIPTLSINPFFIENVKYDPLKDFTSISVIANTQIMLAVNNELNIKSFNELIQYGKSNQNKLSYASSGTGTLTHLMGKLFEDKFNIPLLHVPYKGAGLLIPDLISGRISIAFNSPAALGPFVKNEKIKALAITGSKRHPAFLDIPTFNELNVKDLDIVSSFAIFGPPELPTEIVNILSNKLSKIINSPDMKEEYIKIGFEIQTSTPQQLQTILKNDIIKWQNFLKSKNFSEK